MVGISPPPQQKSAKPGQGSNRNGDPQEVDTRKQTRSTLPPRSIADEQKTEQLQPSGSLVKHISSLEQLPRIVQLLSGKEARGIELKFTNSDAARLVRAFILDMPKDLSQIHASVATYLTDQGLPDAHVASLMKEFGVRKIPSRSILKSQTFDLSKFEPKGDVEAGLMKEDEPTAKGKALAGVMHEFASRQGDNQPVVHFVIPPEGASRDAVREQLRTFCNEILKDEVVRDAQLSCVRVVDFNDFNAKLLHFSKYISVTDFLGHARDKRTEPPSSEPKPADPKSPPGPGTHSQTSIDDSLDIALSVYQEAANDIDLTVNDATKQSPLSAKGSETGDISAKSASNQGANWTVSRDGVEAVLTDKWLVELLKQPNKAEDAGDEIRLSLAAKIEALRSVEGLGDGATEARYAAFEDLSRRFEQPLNKVMEMWNARATGGSTEALYNDAKVLNKFAVGINRVMRTSPKYLEFTNEELTEVWSAVEGLRAAVSLLSGDESFTPWKVTDLGLHMCSVQSVDPESGVAIATTEDGRQVKLTKLGHGTYSNKAPGKPVMFTRMSKAEQQLPSEGDTLLAFLTFRDEPIDQLSPPGLRERLGAGQPSRDGALTAVCYQIARAASDRKGDKSSARPLGQTASSSIKPDSGVSDTDPSEQESRRVKLSAEATAELRRFAACASAEGNFSFRLHSEDFQVAYELQDQGLITFDVDPDGLYGMMALTAQGERVTRGLTFGQGNGQSLS